MSSHKNQKQHAASSAQNAPSPSFLGALHTQNLTQLTALLGQNRFWPVLPEGENDNGKASALFDTQTGNLHLPTTTLRAFFDQHPFIYVEALTSNTRLATLQSSTKLLWNNETSNTEYKLAQGKPVVKKGCWAGLDNWQLPTKEMLAAFAKASSNPHRKGNAHRLAKFDGNENHIWLITDGGCCVDERHWNVFSEWSCPIFACNPLWQDASDAAIFTDLASKGWRLRSVSNTNATFESSFDKRWQGLSTEALLAIWVADRLHLRAADNNKLSLNPQNFWISSQLKNLDNTPCRLPLLDNAQLSDPEKGLWELWGEDKDFLKKLGCIARDPGRDVQHRAVAIDFGTSSTVVAMDTASGARELLRIGVRDFFQTVEAQHFENPTMLECLDFKAFEAAWHGVAYRPALDWDWMRGSHEAQASFRDNPGDTVVLSSILPRLKQWALRSHEHRRVRLTDRQGHEMELATHTERTPVRGQPLAVGSTDPFDPVELYAWYLGMAINWRGRGLFLKYYLSFPVKYPSDVKARILASFSRGLQRSLPRTLIEHHPQVLNDFEVSNLASEPAAYAAAALRHLDVQPSDEGVPYAVFDFGGGTSDFDFGLLRWATAAEEAKGYEQVFEHLASSGDNALGGENLLEHLVYESFRHNLEVLRKEHIQFTLPLQAPAFAGSEAFLAPTQAAQTNTIMLAAKLRPFLESDKPNLSSQLKLDLIDGHGQKKTCELVLDTKALDALLAQRMRGGVEAFLDELAKLRPALPANTPIHLLLAGNGCRSRHIQALFDSQGPLWSELLSGAFGESPPDIVVHAPLPMDKANPYAPTAKTGVALGLLRLVPGENTLLQDHVQLRYDGQAPFAWYTGRLRRDSFEPTLVPGAAYQQWTELGALQKGVFNLFVTKSPRAHSGLREGHPELKKHRMDFPAAPANARLFARPVAPHTLELAAALEASALDGDTVTTSLRLE